MDFLISKISALKKFTLFYICLAASCFTIREIIDFDIWLHIKTGQWIIYHHKLPDSQLYSFMIEGKKWIDHEWLFQVLVSLIYKSFSSNGLILFCFFIFLLIFCLFYQVAKKNKYFLLSALAVFASSQIILVRVTPRPDIISLLFICVFLYLIKNHIHENYIFLLVPIQIAWVNIHGYFILGPLLILICIIAELIKAKTHLPFSWNESKLPPKRINTLIWLFIILLASCLINPYFLEGLIYPFRIIQSSLAAHGDYIYKFISELEPINFKRIIFTQNSYVFLMLFIFSLSLLLNVKKIDIFDIFVFLLFLFLQMKAFRHIAFFTISTTMLSLYNLKEYDGTLAKMFKLNRLYIKPIFYKLAASLVVILMIWSMTASLYAYSQKTYVYDLKGNTKNFTTGVSGLNFPNEAADFLNKTKGAVNLFNNFNCGSYLIFRLYPENKVYIDGRTELYGTDYIKNYESLFSKPEKIDELAEKFNIQYIVFSFFSQSRVPKEAFYALYNSKKWALVFLDNKSAVFVWACPQFEEVIKSSRVDLKSFKIDTQEALLKIAAAKKSYPASYINMALFFSKIGMFDKMLESLNIAETVSPGSFEIPYLKASAFAGMKNDKAALDEFLKMEKIDPYNPELYRNIGVAYVKLNKLDEAIAAFNKALKLAPRYEEVKRYISEVKEMIKK